MRTEPSKFKRGEFEYNVYYQDSKDMSTIPDGKIQLIITSPPYYNLKDYNGKPQKQKGQLPHSPKQFHKTYEVYLDEMFEIWKECARVLSKTGVILINVDVIKHKNRDKIIPLPFDILQQWERLGLFCKDIWIYKKLTGVPFQLGKKLKNRHEYILMFAKTNDYKWNIDDVREPYEEDYIYPEGHKRRNPIGKAPSSVWEFYPPFQTGTQHYHYCPFPDDLVDRAIKLFTDKSDWVLDPFLGSGKVVARAKVLERNGIGFEINPIFRETIEKMIREAKPLEQNKIVLKKKSHSQKSLYSL